MSKTTPKRKKFSVPWPKNEEKPGPSAAIDSDDSEYTDLEEEAEPGKEFDSKQLLYFFNLQAAEQYDKQRTRDDRTVWKMGQLSLLEAETKALKKQKPVSWPALRQPFIRAAKRGRKPRKKLPPSALLPTTYAKVEVTNKAGKTKIQKVPIIMMPKVEAEPPMIHWTETTKNYRVEDGEFLANYPYLGEDADQDFENELYEMYGEKDYNSVQKPTMPDEVFFFTVKKFEKELIKRRNESVSTKNRPTDYDDDLKRCWRMGMYIPCREIFSLVADAFPFLGFPYELEERFVKIHKSLRGKPGYNSETDDATVPTQNIDLPMKNALSAEAAVSSFHKLFCRRCMLYCCLTHDQEDQLESAYLRLNILENDDDCPINIDAGCEEVKKDLVGKSEPWTPNEITLFKVLTKNSKERCCYISAIMKTKTCAQIYKYVKENKTEQPLSNLKPVEVVPPPKSEVPEAGSSSSGCSKKSKKAEKFVPRPWTAGEDLPHYKPCLHVDGGCCNTDNECSCVFNGTYCEKFCSCSDLCIRRFKGCKCKATCSTIACPCYRAHRECDPEFCTKCGSENIVPQEGRCQNVAILRRWEKEIILKPSKVSGWGAFVNTDVNKWELIEEYRGEIISNNESGRRGLYYDKIRHTYLFCLNEDLVVDATRIGSKVRFVNSSKNPNCFPKIMMVNGDHRIGLYASKKIKAGEELFFDYEHVIRQTSKKNETSQSKKKKK